MVCIFNFFVVSSSFTSSISLFPDIFLEGSIHIPARSLLWQSAHRTRRAPFHVLAKRCCGAWRREGSALKSAIEWEKSTLQGDTGYLTQAASQNWWWCKWYAVLYGKGFVAVCRLLYLQMVADSKRAGNYHLNSATVLAFSYVVWRCSLMHFEWCIWTGNLNSYLSFLSVLISAARVGIWSYFSVICLALKASFPICLSLAEAVGLTLIHVFILHALVILFFNLPVFLFITVYIGVLFVPSHLSWSFSWVSGWKLLLCVARSLLGLCI